MGGQSTGTAVKKASIDEIKSNMRGELLGSNDTGYDDARKIWNGMIDKRPAWIACCAGAGDVIHAVRFAREQNLSVAVRGGGHSVAGASLCDDGLVINLSAMKGMRVDPAGRTVHAQPGLNLGEFDRETQAFGLATPLGVATDTGLAGLTLGGGYGWLGGKYGLTCDNLISADMVTADERLVTASAVENEDLFWGLRGGGGNFGIVTSFEYRMYHVTTVLGGMIIYPMAHAKEVLRFFYEFASTAPDELTSIALLLTTPDGDPAVAIATCYCGSPEEGVKVLKPLHSFGSPLADLVGPMPFLKLQSMVDDAFLPGDLYYWKASILRKLPEEAIETLVEYAQRMPSPLSSIGLQQLHGAAGRVGPTETAFPHRFDHFDFFPVARWKDPKDNEKNIEWARAYWKAMQPFVEKQVYVNDLGEEGEERVREAYGPNYDRLATLKKKYDPDNFFRLNQNIKPK